MNVRAVLLRAVAVAVGLSLGLSVAEAGLRIVAPQEKSWLDIYRTDPVLPLVSLAPGVAATVETGESRWHVYTDLRGRRIGQAGPSSAGRPVLLVLGDSFAFGHGVDYEESFPALVAQRLDGRYSVVNTGVPGYGPVQYRQILASLLASGDRPAAVLLSLYLGNDFLDCIWDKHVQVVDGTMVEEGGGFRTWLKRNLHSYRLVSKVYQRLLSWSRPGRDPQEQLFYSEAWSQGDLARARAIFRSELLQIAELCRQAGVPILAVVIPKETSLTSTAPVGEGQPDYTLPVAEAAEALQAAGIPYVDLTESLRALGAANAFFARDGHLTRLGNETASAEIVRGLHGVLATHAN